MSLWRLCSSRVLVVLAICFAGAAQAQNRQAISTSLTECSMIYAELAALGARKGKDGATVNAMQATSTVFLVHARAQAEAEGRPDPYAAIRSEQDRLQEKWDGRFRSFLRLGENKDWIDYCRALGQSRGITPP